MVELDVRDADAVLKLLRSVRPTVVHVPASATNVDACEQDPASARLVNVLGLSNLVRGSNEVGAKLVFYSSDYIWDGVEGPYGENEPASPVSEYGRQKVEGEHLVALQADSFLILRTTVVYGVEPQRKNFVIRLLGALEEGRSVRVPTDQVGSPTYAPGLAGAAVELATSDAGGVWHVAGPDLVSRFDLAREAARCFGLNQALVEPVTTEELEQPAKRPLHAGLRTDKLEARLGRLEGYTDGLALMRAATRL